MLPAPRWFRLVLTLGLGSTLVQATACSSNHPAAPPNESAANPQATAGQATAGQATAGQATAPVPHPTSRKPTTVPTPPKASQKDQGGLRLSELSFAGPGGHRASGIFHRGEHALALLTVRRRGPANRKSTLSARVEVYDRAGTLVHRQVPLRLDPKDSLAAHRGYVRIAIPVVLDVALAPGPHKIRLIVSDDAKAAEVAISGNLKVIGAPLPRSKRLALLALRPAASGPIPVGSALPLRFTIAGTQTEAAGKNRRHRLSLQAALLERGGKVVYEHRRHLRTPLRAISRESLPGHYTLRIPSALKPGSYSVRLTLRDAVSRKEATATMPLALTPKRFAVIHVHLHDASHQIRDQFIFGERAYIRFAVVGFSTKGQPPRGSLEVDVAISGPTGVYFARRKAFELKGARSTPWAKAGRYAQQLSLTLPDMAPAGAYTVLIRARDRFRKKSVTARHTITLGGRAPKRLPTFRVERLDVRLRADLAPIPGDTFVGGTTYHLQVRAGGGALKKTARATFHAKVEGTLRLRTAKGIEVQTLKGLFKLDRRFHYQPLRLVLNAAWTAPANLPPGLYELDITVSEQNTHRVSSLRRRIELKRPAPAQLGKQ